MCWCAKTKIRVQSSECWMSEQWKRAQKKEKYSRLFDAPTLWRQFEEFLFLFHHASVSAPQKQARYRNDFSEVVVEVPSFDLKHIALAPLVWAVKWNKDFVDVLCDRSTSCNIWLRRTVSIIFFCISFSYKRFHWIKSSSLTSRQTHNFLFGCISVHWETSGVWECELCTGQFRPGSSFAVQTHKCIFCCMTVTVNMDFAQRKNGGRAHMCTESNNRLQLLHVVVLLSGGIVCIKY